MSEYSEDEEEWIWRNAVIVDNQVRHRLWTLTWIDTDPVFLFSLPPSCINFGPDIISTICVSCALMSLLPCSKSYNLPGCVVRGLQIFHATCRADAAATTSSAANRLLTSEPASVSRQRSASPASARGSTPQPVNLGVPSSPLRQSVKQEDTDSRAGTPGVKRKVGDQDGPGEEEVEDVQVKKERS